MKSIKGDDNDHQNESLCGKDSSENPYAKPTRRKEGTRAVGYAEPLEQSCLMSSSEAKPAQSGFLRVEFWVLVSNSKQLDTIKEHKQFQSAKHCVDCLQAALKTLHGNSSLRLFSLYEVFDEIQWVRVENLENQIQEIPSPKEPGEVCVGWGWIPIRPLSYEHVVLLRHACAGTHGLRVSIQGQSLPCKCVAMECIDEANELQMEFINCKCSFSNNRP